MVKRTHGDAGLPAHRWSDADGPLARGELATVTQLKRMRRKPADGQQAVGEVWSAKFWALLYVVADSVEMPALSPKRQATYDLARTCVRCRTVNQVPWDMHYDMGDQTTPQGRKCGRFCYRCYQIELQVLAAARANRDRAAAIAHAQQLLADPTLTVLYEHPYKDDRGNEKTFRAVAVNGGGEVLLDVTVQYVYWGWGGQLGETVSPGPGVPIAEIAEEVKSLDGRTIVAWTSWNNGRLDLHLFRGCGIRADLTAVRYTRDSRYAPDGRRLESVPSFGGELSYLFAHWMGIPEYQGRPDWYQPKSWTLAEATELITGEPPADPEDTAHGLLNLLRYIAHDDHPGGAAVCPQRDGLADPCGAPPMPNTGFCEQHGEQETDLQQQTTIQIGQ